ncbi:MAG: amidase family protein, partial [Gemmatimonadales bacterium]
AGIIPISHSQDTAGPIARTVADAAALLTALAGTDPLDEATAEADQHKSDFTRALDADGLRGARVGVLRPAAAGGAGGGGGGNIDARIQALYDAAIGVLRQRGADLVDPVTLTVQLQNGGDLLQYEFKADLERYLAEWAPSANVHNLDDLIAFNTREADRELKYFGQEIFEQSTKKGPLTTPEYVQLKERLQHTARDGIDTLMTTNRIDAIVAVTSGPARPIDLVSGDSGGPGGGPGGTGIAATAGYPHITLPMGYIRGLPVGLSFFGAKWSEATLIKLAFAYEQASRMRRPPKFAAGPEL